MRVSVDPGTYVLAVSGGVDSMVLLDLLKNHPRVKVVVAHFDHGIREDSDEDRRLVEQIAKKHGLPFVYEQAKLGKGTSEARAREARYTFLEKVRTSTGATAIITAHHQDDALETAIMNLLRGTGRRGLSSLKATDGILRPMLEYNKERIRDYAVSHKIAWREDSTNTDANYRRNYIRHHILPKFSPGQRAQLIILLQDIKHANELLDRELINLLHTQPDSAVIDRHWFIRLPHDIAREVLHAWLRHRGAKNITKKTIERLVAGIKTGKAGNKLDVDQRFCIKLGKNDARLTIRTG